VTVAVVMVRAVYKGFNGTAPPKAHALPKVAFTAEAHRKYEDIVENEFHRFDGGTGQIDDDHSAKAFLICVATALIDEGICERCLLNDIPKALDRAPSGLRMCSNPAVWVRDELQPCHVARSAQEDMEKDSGLADSTNDGSVKEENPLAQSRQQSKAPTNTNEDIPMVELQTDGATKVSVIHL